MANPGQKHIVHNRHPLEDPVYSNLRPEHSGLNNSIGGTTKHGDQINGGYKQPWVEHDGVVDPTGEQKIG